MIITGFSGAGKSTAMHLFEDAGYFCVDNLPPEMIGHLAELFVHEGSKVERSAVVCDVRGGDYFEGLVEVLDELERTGVAHRVLFLDADEQTLLTRFKETRRRHPLSPEGSVADGIAARAPAARAAERARRPRDRHVRPQGVAAAQADRRRDAADADAGQARRQLHELRPQARPAARRRPQLRRPLPARTRTTSRAAPAHRAATRGSSSTSTAAASSTRSTSTSSRCSTTCCRATSRRARPT